MLGYRGLMLIELWLCDALIIFPIHCFKGLYLSLTLRKYFVLIMNLLYFQLKKLFEESQQTIKKFEAEVST